MIIVSGSNQDQVVCDTNEKSRNSDQANHHEDLISNLPDSLIGHILSYLSLEDAVRTSVLSREWEFKWTLLYDFDILHQNSEEQEATFVNFVERVFLHAQRIRCLELTYFTECDMSQFASWISAAVRRKIEILSIDHFVWCPYEREKDEYDFCLLDNCSLRKLTLISLCFKFPTEVCLPNLTTLKLFRVLIGNESSNSDHLKYTFPVLKTLEMTLCIWLKVKLVEIHAPKLTIFVSTGDNRVLDVADDEYTIKVIGDKLEELFTSCHLPNEVVVTGSQVVDAGFRYWPGPTDGDDRVSRKKGLQVLRLLTGFSNLTKLTLTNSIVEAMRKCRQQFPLPRFVKLVQLSLLSSVSREGLLELLQATPHLKILTMLVNNRGSWKHDDYDEVESVPSCVVSHLEEVLFTYMEGVDPEYHLEKFLLKNGTELKKVHVYQVMRGDRILKKLSAFPKASTSLTFRTPAYKEAFRPGLYRGYYY